MSQEIMALVTMGTVPGSDLAAVRKPFFSKLERVGVTPLLVSAEMGKRAIQRLYEQSNGVIFTGGSDIDPAYYGAEKHPKTIADDPRRDEMELELAQWILADDKPGLGMCRGNQILAVATGAVLRQHLPDITQVHHTVSSYAELLHNIHDVDIADSSKAHDIFEKAQIRMTSGHHQAVHSRNSGAFRITGVATDGIAEVIEHPNRRFLVGIQGHAEVLGSIIVFQKFVSAMVL